MLFGSKDSILGIDIGFETLKLVELKKSGKDFELIGCVEVPLTERILEKDRFKDKEVTSRILKEACKKAKPHPITARRIVTALPETFVFSKTIKMPKMSDLDMKNAVVTEAAQYLPIPISETYVDYQVLMVHPDEPMVDILFVAIPKKLVDDYVEMTKMAGFELLALETKPLAVGRAVIGSNQANQALAVVEIGTELTRIAIWENGNIRLASSVSTGANKIREAYESLNIKQSKTPTDDELHELSPVLSAVSDEIINAIRYHQNRDYKPKPITEILLSGSGAKFPGIDKLIEKTLKIKASIVEPRLKNEKIGPEYVTAAGLAMRSEY